MASTKHYSEEIKNSYIIIAVVLIAVAVVMILQSPQRLNYVEVREYDGEKLSSINDFQENSIKGPQYVNISAYNLTINGRVNQPKSYSYEDVTSKKNYEKVVTLHCVEGWDVTILWQGILLSDLLNETGVDPKANTVIFYAYDGYSTSLPLDYVIQNDIMLAYKMNGVTLPPERGFPFQLVAESKFGYKWIKWITRIELSDDESYRGYWESRGYSNDAGI
jgi:DMSO/TMAO reductase YedYZ molybdopterin-dependent catalytic subunit